MTSAGSAPDPADRVADLAATAVAPYRMLVDEAAVVNAGSRRIVRITLDRDLADLPEEDHTSPVPPLDLDAVADASRAVDAALEEQATSLFGDRPYLLEIGSAGAERTLTLPRHYRANVGRLADVTLTDGRSLLARIVAAGPDRLTLRSEPDPQAPPRRGTRARRGARDATARNEAGGAAAGSAVVDQVARYDEIARARVRVEFGRAWDEPFDPPSGDGDATGLADGFDGTDGLDGAGGLDEFAEFDEDLASDGMADERAGVVAGDDGSGATARAPGGLED